MVWTETEENNGGNSRWKLSDSPPTEEKNPTTSTALRAVASVSDAAEWSNGYLSWEFGLWLTLVPVRWWSRRLSALFKGEGPLWFQRVHWLAPTEATWFDDHDVGWNTGVYPARDRRKAYTRSHSRDRRTCKSSYSLSVSTAYSPSPTPRERSCSGHLLFRRRWWGRCTSSGDPAIGGTDIPTCNLASAISSQLLRLVLIIFQLITAFRHE